MSDRLLKTLSAGQSGEYALYLELRPKVKREHLSHFLSQAGLSLISDPSFVHTYTYALQKEQARAFWNLMLVPGDDLVYGCTIRIPIRYAYEALARTFQILKELSTVIPFELIDLELRNQILERMSTSTKLTSYHTGLSEKEWKHIRQQAVIPVDWYAFFRNEEKINKRILIFTSLAV
ncbi:MAG: hypothetical protein AAF824_12985 [Bacteroidota bacterium]